MKAYYYNSSYLCFGPRATLAEQIQANYAGLKLFRCVFNIFAMSMTFYDRTETITQPIKMARVDGFDMPIGDKFRPQPYTFEDICNMRAIELMDQAKRQDRKLVVMYSGGIDSTLVLVSLFKMCSEQDIKDRLVVIMSGTSIDENKNFYRNHIIKKVDVIQHANTFTYQIGNPNSILISGEGNDQLFGSLVSLEYGITYGEKSLYERLDPSRIIAYYEGKTKSRLLAEQMYNLLQPVIAKAPMDINTPYLYFWWLNMTLKWQSVFVRSSSYARPEHHATVKYGDNYQMFFDNHDFQLWVMNNPDKLIYGEWRTYKQECKEIIYQYNKDEEYRLNKTKWGSLKAVLLQKKPTVVIDDSMNYHYDFPMELLQEKNSFSEM
jgi:hypothetical protein